MSKTKRKSYGYTRDKDGRLVEVPEEQQVINDIVRWFHVNYRSDQWIADDLNEEGIPTQRGGQWARTSVKNVREKHEEERAPDMIREHEAAQSKQQEEAGAKFQQWIDEEEKRAEEEGFLHEYTFFDADKGEERTQAMWISASQHMENKQIHALQELMRHEGTSVFRYHKFGNSADPLSLKYVDTIIERLAKEKFGENIHSAVGRIKDQPSVKRNVRNHVNAVIHELAVMYQENVHLRQVLADLGDVRERELTPEQAASLDMLRGEMLAAGTSSEERSKAIRQWAIERPRTALEALEVEKMIRMAMREELEEA